jgi:hypothetical protein
MFGEENACTSTDTAVFLVPPAGFETAEASAPGGEVPPPNRSPASMVSRSRMRGA